LAQTFLFLTCFDPNEKYPADATNRRVCSQATMKFFKGYVASIPSPSNPIACNAVEWHDMITVLMVRAVRPQSNPIHRWQEIFDAEEWEYCMVEFDQ
jgi:hypothetical protein